MVSGNFVLMDGPSLEKFNERVVPVLKEVGITIQDKMVCREGHKSHLLFSVHTKRLLSPYDCIPDPGVLEGAMGEKVKGLQGVLQDEVQTSGMSIGIYSHQLNGFETVGVYQEDDAAYRLFPSIAHQYLLASLDNQTDEVAEKIRDLLSQKLSDLT